MGAGCGDCPDDWYDDPRHGLATENETTWGFFMVSMIIMFFVVGFLLGLNNQTKMCAQYSPRNGELGHICVEDNPEGRREAVYYPPGMMP